MSPCSHNNLHVNYNSIIPCNCTNKCSVDLEQIYARTHSRSYKNQRKSVENKTGTVFICIIEETSIH